MPPVFDYHNGSFPTLDGKSLLTVKSFSVDVEAEKDHQGVALLTISLWVKACEFTKRGEVG